MKKLLVIFAMFVSMSASGQPSWQSYTIDTSQNLNFVKFTNTQTGFVTSNRLFLKTTNGGVNWVLLNTTYRLFVTQFIIDPNMLWYSDYMQLSVPPYNPIGNLFKSVNGGSIWSLVLSDFNIGYNDIYFLNALTGWSRVNWYLYRTTNGGSNWVTFTLPTWITGLHFLNLNYGFCRSANGTNNIYRSSNGGANWTSIYTTNNSISNFTFLDTINGYLCANVINNSFHGLVSKTTNGGYNWTEILRDSNNINNIFFVNVNTGYALSKPHTLFRTSNGGLNWSKQIPDSTETLNAIHFINAYTGWLAGNHGLLLYTTNGGSTFVNEINGNIPEKYLLSQNYPNPFNPTTKIQFEVPSSKFVKIVVFDILGKEVQTLVNESLQPGTYETSFDGSSLTSGVYFYRLITNEFTETKKMLLIK